MCTAAAPNIALLLLSTQVEDRRSSVSKQACQLLSTLSSVLGLRFQEQLAHFLPVLFKVLPITVQVKGKAGSTWLLLLAVVVAVNTALGPVRTAQRRQG